MTERREDGSLVRHEEELRVEPGGWVETGRLGIRKEVEPVEVDEVVSRDAERVELETAPAHEQDSGEVETLPDGSISIPVLEEELVVTKRTVVRERLIVRKGHVTERRRVQATLRKERVEIEAPDEDA